MCFVLFKYVAVQTSAWCCRHTHELSSAAPAGLHPEPYGRIKTSALFCLCTHAFVSLLLLQVYILSRMGNSRAALALIIERLQDIPRAIEFVRLQRDDELIEELIDWALRSADTTGGARASEGVVLCYSVVMQCCV
jgi:hypothetical protein